ncbi:hypothetical protein F5Y09DRAFT_354467 [Xylaria sp. FL1042]|nr:hypothetical protein F5Y09DRAFT_354467 [Xylaria sp. FL1042]
MCAKFMKDSIPTLEAISSAKDRFCQDRRGRLDKIPPEIKMMIVCRIPDSKSIFNLALTGPDYCEIITAHEKTLTIEMLNLYIPGSIMHLAITSHVVITASWAFHNHVVRAPLNRQGQTQAQAPGRVQTRSQTRAREQGQEMSIISGLDYENAVLAFTEWFRQNENLTLSQQFPGGLTLQQAEELLELHHAVRYYARVLSSEAMDLMPYIWDLRGEATPTMLLRYEKALYIMQLVSELFSWRDRVNTPPMNQAWGTFWYHFYPWEVEQVFCVQKLLERHIADVLSDATGHPVYYHAMQMIARFTVCNGPWRLWELETKRPGGNTLRSRFRDFESIRIHHEKYISMGVAAPGFGFQVILPKIGQKLASPTWETDFDLGPMRLWYFLALRQDVEWCFHRWRRPYYLNDMRTMVYAGYALWDEIPGVCLGEIQTMHKLLMRHLEGEWETMAGKPLGNRVALIFFRMTEPRRAEGFPQSFPNPTSGPAEYCYTMEGEILAEAAEKKRQETVSGPEE